jgi:hypothetical protein
VNGACTPAGQGCTPQNCPDGCCAGSGATATCQNGTSDAQCGTGGASCQACNTAAGEQCASQACAAPPNDVGATCSVDVQCSSIDPIFAFCVPPTQSDGGSSGWSGGYCTSDCTPATGVDCGPGAVCLEFAPDDMGNQQAFCLSQCNAPKTGQSNCRSGYACTSYTLTDGGVSGFCYPSCNVAGAECLAGETCNVNGYCCPNDGGPCYD